jgi:hypothetical protein
MVARRYNALTLSAPTLSRSYCLGVNPSPVSSSKARFIAADRIKFSNTLFTPFFTNLFDNSMRTSDE